MTPVVWNQWVSNSATGFAGLGTAMQRMSTAAGTVGDTWNQWVTTYTTATSTTLSGWQENAWTQWQAQDYVYRRTHRQLTPEEQDELQARREQRSREQL